MRSDEKRPYYKPPSRLDPPRMQWLECILAVLGAIFMAIVFISAFVVFEAK